MDITEEIAKGIIMLCLELAKRRQSARTLNIIKAREISKLVSVVESGNISPGTLSAIDDANVLWSSLITALKNHDAIITPEISEALQSNSSGQLRDLIHAMPLHHKNLIAAVILTIESLGDDNTALAKIMFKELGSAIISPGNGKPSKFYKLLRG